MERTRQPSDGEDDEVRAYCRQRGYSTAVVNGGIDYLVKKWEWTADAIAAAKPPEFYYYLNCMDVRHILFEVIPVATEEQWENVRDRLERADAIVLEHTDSLVRCIWGEDNARRRGLERDRHWWYFRKPKAPIENWKER